VGGAARGLRADSVDDAVCFREWARLIEGKQDHIIEDAMIAVTARIHGLIVATRNDQDFAPFDVQVVSPFRGEE
jgi:toxin FitB